MLFKILIFLLLLNYCVCFFNEIRNVDYNIDHEIKANRRDYNLRGGYQIEKNKIINILINRMYEKRYQNILLYSAIGRYYYETSFFCNINNIENNINNINDLINKSSPNELKALLFGFYADTDTNPNKLSLNEQLIIIKIYNIDKELIIKDVINKLFLSSPDIKIDTYNKNSCNYYNISW